MSDSDNETAANRTIINNNHIPVPKHLRRRYWTSWEEMKLVEIWRRYSDDVTTTLKHIPVFLNISNDMREWGFQVNSQECRRMIIQLKKKYYAERKRIEDSGAGHLDYEWKLYPLIHSFLQTPTKVKDGHHEQNILKQFLAKMPPISPAQRRQRRIVTLDIKADPVAKQEISFAKQTPPLTPQPQSQQQQPTITNPYKRTYNTFSSTYCNAASSLCLNRNAAVPDMRQRRFGAKSSLHPFKIPRLEDIQQDNKRLAERRDFALRNLYMQQRKVNMFEKLVQGLQQCGGK